MHDLKNAHLECGTDTKLQFGSQIAICEHQDADCHRQDASCTPRLHLVDDSLHLVVDTDADKHIRGRQYSGKTCLKAILLQPLLPPLSYNFYVMRYYILVIFYGYGTPMIGIFFK